jgi:hypothetical protein
MTNKLINTINQIKKKYINKLDDWTYIYPDDRQYIETGNLIKYIDIDTKQKLKSGVVLKITNNKIFLKSTNSSLTWSINFTNYHIFYKFKNNSLFDTLHGLFEINSENNEKY